MAAPSGDDEKPLSPEQEALVARVRRMSMLSGVATLLGIAVVIGVVGYRIFRSDGSVPPGEVVAMLPKGAKVISTATSEDRIVVTLDVAGSTEIRTFDLRSLKALGRLRFASEP
ncbi:MAG: hypothetical protein AB7K35_06020 [Pseudorhodoplanes sp.]